jgi:prepilin-type N-terminal cleavage/methylation domain-containing protein
MPGPTTPRRRPGVTLVELVVALGVFGVAAAFALPALLFPRETTPTLDAVARRARELAIHRAQPLTLHIEAEGRWLLQAPDAGEPVVDRGRLTAMSDAVRIDVSALGRCVVRAGPSWLSTRWDAGRCLTMQAS